MSGMFGWSYPAGAASDPYAPYNDTSGDCEDQVEVKLTKSQKAKIKRIETALAKAEKAPFKKRIPTFAECWAGVEEYIPESGKIEQEEAGDWTPYWCDDCDTWHSTAYAMDIVRKSDVMEGRDCFEIRSVDQDGNWDFDTATYDGDP